MSIFLALKQIVDILFQFTILDYSMVVIAAFMVVFGFFKFGYYKEFSKRIVPADIIMLCLFVVYFLSFLRDTGAYSKFVKTESAFFIYFLGRVYSEKFYNEIKSESVFSKIIPLSSYIILFLNLIYKMYIQFTYTFTGNYVGRKSDFDVTSDGALYYYKTDMAIGVIVCIVFIYALSKKKWLKWIAIFPVGIYMLFYRTNARSGQAILILEYMFIIFLELRKKGVFKKIKISEKSVKVFGAILLSAVTAFLVFIQLFTPLKTNLEELGLGEDIMTKLENIFHSRHLIWWDAISYYVKQPFATRFLGIDLTTETLHNPCNDRFHNLYFKQIYAVGYIGTYLFYAALITWLKSLAEKKKSSFSDEKTLYTLKTITVGMWIMFLFISISMEGLEYTQMTWYPFIMMGIMQGGKNDNKQLPV